MKIAFVGKFGYLYDEEYIARSFEQLGHQVYRIEQQSPRDRIIFALDRLDMDVILFAKWEAMPNLAKYKTLGVKTVCWLFDLYWNYNREWRLTNAPYFKADYVFTTDAGNQERFEQLGINHHCVRQGIYKPDCYLEPGHNPQGVAFVGSENPSNIDRRKALDFVSSRYKSFAWYGRENTNELRGRLLNELYARTRVVVGDSVYSPYYWSNRVVETLGRGGFLIHQDVPGLKEEYPDLAMYPRGDMLALSRTIDYYLAHEDERLELVRKNFKHVRDNYTMEKKCVELLSYLDVATR